MEQSLELLVYFPEIKYVVWPEQGVKKMKLSLNNKSGSLIWHLLTVHKIDSHLITKKLQNLVYFIQANGNLTLVKITDKTEANAGLFCQFCLCKLGDDHSSACIMNLTGYESNSKILRTRKPGVH